MSKARAAVAGFLALGLIAGLAPTVAADGVATNTTAEAPESPIDYCLQVNPPWPVDDDGKIGVTVKIGQPC